MPEKTLTIIFRGLLVFRQQGTGSDSYFEVGILPTAAHTPPHIPRILTYKNGVLDAVKSLVGVHQDIRHWRLKVSDPVTIGVSKDQQGETFDRKTHEYARDYRFLMDLEDSKEFYGPLIGKIHPSFGLGPVLRISNGSFYTRLKSHKVDRQKDGEDFEFFGFVASAIGCDIKLNGNEAKLVREDDQNIEIFSFDLDDTGKTLYEISNSPADTYIPPPFPSTEGDHFQHYYHIFNVPEPPRFHFKESSSATGPSPALCGEVGLGQFPDPL